MRKHVLFVTGLLGFLLVNAVVIRHCWTGRDTARPTDQHRRPLKPGTATALTEER